MPLKDKELKELIVFRNRIELSNRDDHKKLSRFYQLFTLIVTKVSDDTGIQFTSLFARLSFLISTYNIPHQESFILHCFRRLTVEDRNTTGSNKLMLAETALKILFHRCLQHAEELGMVVHIYQDLSQGWGQQKASYFKSIKVLFHDIDLDNKRIAAQLTTEPFDQISIAYDRPDRNEDYTSIIQEVKGANILPVLVNLVDVEISKDGTYYPGSMVLEPDFLYDVTAISECFGPFANHQATYLMRKFLKKPVSKPLLIGNLVNYFLDQLVYHPNLKFEDFIPNIFTQDPLGVTLLNDQEVREMMVLIEQHFNNIKDVVNSGLAKINVDEDSCQVEPSFYSAKYGLQGRLDLFSLNEDNANIIELKSGSTFRPNNYGLSNNHYHQTLLYDMLIESVYGSKIKRNNFILYSKESANPLRYAPALKSEQRETIKERNRLYLHDRKLLETEDFISYYQDYAKSHSNEIKGFLRKDLTCFLKSVLALEDIEKKYCNLLLQFTLRELFINKLGNEGSEKSNGLASLWLENLEIKKEHYNIINQLEIVEDFSNDDNPRLILKRTDKTIALNNFRIGDLGVLYPAGKTNDAVLKHQVFKATILSLGDEIILRLRSRQDNPHTFSNFKYWNVEHDSLENGYYDMSRSIAEFAAAKPEFRKLIMGRVAPEIYSTEMINCSHHLTKEQSQIFSEIVQSKDYYLLWGPPGTGKTSVMLREMAQHYIFHEKDRVLFLAYTNRAVDEICDALTSLEPEPSFIRIGSRYSTAERFHGKLLENQISGIKDRKTLRNRLRKEQIYVGTVASMVGKVALFELINFDVAIVDEASQILETSLIGLLSRVNKFILIGDHQQLPAIVRQDKSLGKVEDDTLRGVGIKNLTNSLFERMYRSAIRNEWGHAIGQLTAQGRMHVDIMSFVNKHFYNNQLHPLPGLERLNAPSCFKDKDPLDRIVFIDSDVDIKSESIKVNNREAEIVARICQTTIDRYLSSSLPIYDNSIGIITPYRAQIAAIREKLKHIDPDVLKKITIDTVERYQGGARDIILMSCCMNYSFQLKALVSMSEEGVDRKLNVALTRAKEQFILIGNADILGQNEVYNHLIRASKKIVI